MPIALAIAALVLGVVNLLVMVWCVLRTLESEVKEQLLEYSVGVAMYNDAVQSMAGREVTVEEELSITAMQERLSQQAKDMGLSYVPFQRPKGVDGPD